MKVTRAEVAKRAGVSVATVSNVLNNNGKVKEQTAVHVRRVIDEMRYRPNMIAKSMTTNRTMQLGIVLENLSNTYFADIVRGFEQAANDCGYFVNICTGFNKVNDYFESFISRSLDGVFVMALPYRFDINRLYELIDHDIKVVMSGDMDVDRNRIATIENNYVQAIDVAVRHLYRLGHRRIAYVSGLNRALGYDQRIAGYLKTLAELGLPYGDDLLIDADNVFTTDIEDGIALTHKLLATGKRFTAVVCTNDLMALGAMDALNQAGLRVPEDVSIIGFDGIKIGRYWRPALTTMSLDKLKFGGEAFEMLHGYMLRDKPESSEREMELVVGASTAPPPAGGAG